MNQESEWSIEFYSFSSALGKLDPSNSSIQFTNPVITDNTNQQQTLQLAPNEMIYYQYNSYLSFNNTPSTPSESKSMIMTSVGGSETMSQQTSEPYNNSLLHSNQQLIDTSSVVYDSSNGCYNHQPPAYYDPISTNETGGTSNQDNISRYYQHHQISNNLYTSYSQYPTYNNF